MNDPEKIVQLCAEIARPQMLPFMQWNSCVSACRVVMDTLHTFGIGAMPVPTRMVVRWEKGKKLYTVGHGRIGTRAFPESGQGWDGHLLVFAADRFLIDPSFDAALVAMGLKPETTMPCLDLAGQNFDWQQFFLEYSADFPCDGQLERLLVEYDSFPDEGYKAGEAWGEQEIILLARSIARQIRERLTLNPARR